MWALLAASVSALTMPILGGDDAVFVSGKIFADQALRNDAVAARLELWVDPKGRVLECKVASFAGSEKAARRACDMFIRRKIDTAARIGDTPSYGLASLVWTWGVDGAATGALKAQLNASAAAADFDFEGAPGTPPVTVQIVAAVNTSGRVEHCSSAPVAPEVDAALCQMISGLSYQKRTDADGQQVPYVRSFNVRLSAP